MIVKELEELDPEWSMDRTIELVSKALATLPESGLDAGQNKLLELAQEKMRQAEEYFERPVDDAEVYRKLIVLNKELGNDDKVKTYQGRIDLFEANKFEFLGRQQDFFGNAVEALKFYDQAVALVPDHELAAPGKEKMEKKLAKARNELPKLKSKAEEKGDAKTVYKLGVAYLATGAVADAIECMDLVLKQDPDNVEALCKKGTAIESLGKWGESIPIFDRALALKETSTTAKRGKNYALFNLGKLD